VLVITPPHDDDETASNTGRVLPIDRLRWLLRAWRILPRR
jgi:hypothetical protein